MRDKIGQPKISKMQYKALLLRALEREPVAQQQSQALGMQQMLGGMQQAPEMSVMQPPQPMDQGIIQPEAPPVQAPAQPGAVPVQDAIAQAEQAWMEIKDTLGGQLWTRLSKSAKPGEQFINEAVMYLRNPVGMTDERKRNFFAGIFPQEEMGQAAPQEEPTDRLSQIILNSMG